MPETEIKAIFFPLIGKVAVEVLEAASKTKGGIILPYHRDRPAMQGKVIAKHENSVLQIDDVVIFGPHAGAEIEVAGYRGKKIIILRETDILSVVIYQEIESIDITRIED